MGDIVVKSGWFQIIYYLKKKDFWERLVYMETDGPILKARV